MQCHTTQPGTGCTTTVHSVFASARTKLNYMCRLSWFHSIHDSARAYVQFSKK